MQKALTPTQMQRDDATELLTYEHGLNWSLPGTGKTMTSMCVIEQGGFSRILVVCPKIAVTMWVETIATQLGLNVIARRAGTSSVWKKPIDDYDAVVTTYAVAASNNARPVLEKWLQNGNSIAILDEAHYCKNKTASRSKALLSPPTKPIKVRGPDGVVHEGRGGVLGDTPGIATHANYVLQLTGTPITRYPDDLWMQLAYVREDILEAYKVKSYRAFVSKFCVEKDMRVGNGNRTVRVTAGAKNEALLRELIEACKPIRRTLEDVAEALPPITERWLTVDVKLPKWVRDLKSHEAFLKLVNDGDGEYAKAWHEIGMSKVEQTADYVLDQYKGQSVLVGFWHKDVGKALARALDAPVVDGSTSTGKRDELRERFNSGDVPILLGQIKAMGVAWNLQEKASSVVLAEIPPSRGDIDQFIARVYRRGQTKHVQVDFIGTDTSIDEGVRNVVYRKQKIVEKVIE